MFCYHTFTHTHTHPTHTPTHTFLWFAIPKKYNEQTYNQLDVHTLSFYESIVETYCLNDVHEFFFYLSYERLATCEYEKCRFLLRS